jgi:hypothetical protein
MLCVNDTLLIFMQDAQGCQTASDCMDLSVATGFEAKNIFKQPLFGQKLRN